MKCQICGTEINIIKSNGMKSGRKYCKDCAKKVIYDNHVPASEKIKFEIKSCECCGKDLGRVASLIRYCEEHRNEYARKRYLGTHRKPKISKKMHPIEEIVDKFVNGAKNSIFEIIEEYTLDLHEQDIIFDKCYKYILKTYGRQFFY